MKHRFAHSVAAAVAIGLTAQTQANANANANKPDTPTEILATSPTQQEMDLFESIVKQDNSRRQERLKKEILGIAETRKSQSSAAHTTIAAQEQLHKERAEFILKSVLTPDAPPPTAAEALFKLATLKRTETSNEALPLLQQALQKLGEDLQQNASLAANILLSMGELYSEAQNHGLARSAFQKAANLANSPAPAMQEVKLRALIGAGDSHFVRFQFELASSAYTPATSLIKNSGIATREVLESYYGPLLVRKFWAQFRAGNYNESFKIAREFARQKPIFKTEIAPEVLADITRSAGIALAEINDVNLAANFVADPLSGELGKEIVVEAMKTNLRSGFFDRAEAIAQSVESQFVRSPSLLPMLSVRWEAAKQANMRALEYKIATLISERLSVDSQWSRHNFSRFSTNAERSSLVAKAAAYASSVAYEEGRRSGSQQSYENAYHFLKVASDENLEGRDNGSLKLRLGELALLANDFTAAKMETQSSLTFALADSQRKSAYHQLVEIARLQERRDSKYFSEYTAAVDAFVRAFPDDPAARLALFECARREETLGNVLGAKERLQRLLASTSPNTPFDAVEKERVTLALLALNARDPNAERANNALSDLERQAESDGLAQNIYSQVQQASANAIRSHAKQLTEKGDLFAAANAQLLWATEHGDNPETPTILRDAAKNFFEIGEINKTREAATVLLTNFPKHKLCTEALYWQGRSLESSLAFSAAANAYVASALNASAALSAAQRLDALQRAQEIFKELNELAWSARIHDEISSIKSRGTPQENRAQERIHVALSYFNAKQYRQAEETFLSVMENEDLSPLVRWRAELGVLSTRLLSQKKPETARKNLDDLASHVVSLSGKKQLAERKEIALDAVLVALKSDLKKTEEFPSQWRKGTSKSQTAALAAIETTASKTFAIVEKEKNNEKRNEAALILSKIRAKTADQFNQASAFLSNSAPQRADTLAQQAEDYRIAARKVIFNALATNATHRVQAATTLAALGGSVELNVEPAPTIVEPNVGAASETVREVLVGALHKETP